MGSEEDPRKWYYEEQRKIQLLRERESKSSGPEAPAAVPIWVMVLIGAAIATGLAGYWLVQSGLAGKAAKLLRILLR